MYFVCECRKYYHNFTTVDQPRSALQQAIHSTASLTNPHDLITSKFKKKRDLQTLTNAERMRYLTWPMQDLVGICSWVECIKESLLSLSYPIILQAIIEPQFRSRFFKESHINLSNGFHFFVGHRECCRDTSRGSNEVSEDNQLVVWPMGEKLRKDRIRNKRGQNCQRRYNLPRYRRKYWL